MKGGSHQREREGHEPRFRLIWTPVLWERDLALDSRQSPLGNAHYVRGDALESISAGCRRTFLRFIFCANLLLSRFFSPGFRKKECFFTSLIMPSCWTCRLKRRSALSMDSPSKIRISAKMCLREICDRAMSMGAPRAKSNASFSD